MDRFRESIFYESGTCVTASTKFVLVTPQKVCNIQDWLLCKIFHVIEAGSE